jgi:rSAM/selenodomain-associated transferase 2
MVSIIIPVLNEEREIKGVLDSVSGYSGKKEVFVIDGGSTDRTADIAKRYAHVYLAKRGRAAQMNAGAAMAKGDILLFVHADCRIEERVFREVEETIEKGFVGGCLTLYSGDSFKYKIIDTIGKMNSTIFKEYFGDHGIFVKRDVFENIGGFKEIPIMEDVEFSKRLRKAGRTKQLKQRIRASTRRFERGFFRTLFTMSVLRVLYAFGVSPKRLVNYYQNVR